MSDTNYLEYTFQIDPVQPASDILLAELSEIGFESFVETETGLVGYVLENTFKETLFGTIHILADPKFHISWQSKTVAQQNWNAVWERSFDPITIGNQCRVRAPFHKAEDVSYDIVIEPKMSFGTGHHETTYMMLKHILDVDFKEKRVLDMGCGTGVLAILSEMVGAKAVDAIDIDSWCYTNSLENIARNGCNAIEVYQGDSALLEGKTYDIILANINRNILLEDIPTYVHCLEKGGVLFLSGFYLSDLDTISSKCSALGLQFEKNLEKNNWVAAKYVF